MNNNFYKKNFLNFSLFNKEDIEFLIKFSSHLKKIRKEKKEKKYLKNKNIILIFEKESTRTRCAFEVAAFEQGANTTYIGPKDSHIGYKESFKDTAKFLSKIYHAIQYRGHEHEKIEELAKYSDITVWNGLTNKFHPTQIIADLLTIKESLPEKKIENISCAYIGDINNNICNSILEISKITGMKINLISPKEYWFQYKRKKNNNVLITENIEKGVKDVDFIYTDIWLSMGETETSWKEKIKFLKNYQVNKNVLKLSKNKEVKFLHCLPSLHDKNTIIGKKILNEYKILGNGVEVTNEVFESKNSLVFEQAENRLHTIKAMMILTLIKNVQF
ncbi:ornithine carbamoyltransferase [Buchnera aphidicola (Neophyllaphis podocarpi)]|uniref:ornithine carbamoyltransferase n=1 Tax=Buchnera aphidicola TaxID=9 RepID=UPI0031B8A038